MTLQRPKCGKTVPDDSIYCPYCAHGLKASAKTVYVSVAGILMIVAASASLILFALSVEALLEIYSWYPRLVAQGWFAYDQLLTLFSFLGGCFGLTAAGLSLSRKSYKWTIFSAIACTVAGGGAWITSMIIPDYKILVSMLYYFSPILLPSLGATLLVVPRKAEFT